MEEQWKGIAGYEDLYEVSNLGNVRRIWTRKGSTAYKPIGCRSKTAVYPNVALSRHDVQIYRNIHVLVAAAFIGPRPVGFVINHIDGNKHNSRADNLEYVTPRRNDEHASLNGLKAYGDRNGARKFPERLCRGEKQWAAKITDVVEIRRRLAFGESCHAIGRELNLHFTTISDIKRRKTWRHVA